MSAAIDLRTILAVGALLHAIASGPARAAIPTLDLDVELEPATRRFHAIALVNSAPRDFRFELDERLTLTAAAADGKALAVDAAKSDGQARGWRVRVPAGAGSVRLEYGGTLAELDRSLDDRGVLGVLPPMASTAGSFLPASSRWYPQPGPLFAYRVSLSVPGSQRAVVPGRLQSEDFPHGASGRYRASFEFAHPATGIDLMAGPWVVGERIVARARGGPLRLRTYFPRELDAVAGLANGYLDDAQRYLERYSEEIGPYPFTEFSVVAGPLPTGFAMATLTYMGADVLRLPFIRATSLGHEVLHNWWGNGAYVDYAQGNWSEGLTTFMADYAYKEHESPEAAREMRLGWLRDFAATPAGDMQPLASFRSRTHGADAAVGYGKSAMLFLMLRDEVGEDAFRRGIRAFWQQHRFAVASWGDLRRAFERAAGRTLVPFFDQWLDRPGGPAVQLVGVRAVTQRGKLRLELTAAQSAPAYALRVPLEVVYGDHSEMRWIELTPERELVSLEVDGQPEGVRLDPDLRVWRVLDRAQLPPILRQWIVARTPRLVLATDAPDVRDAAEAVARRLFENLPQSVPLQALSEGTGPVLLVGLRADVDAALARAGLPPRPNGLSGRGSAQVWTIARHGGPPTAAVSADDAGALNALVTPLRHYGRQSWLVFDGRRAIDRGVWPAPGPLIAVSRQR